MSAIHVRKVFEAIFACIIIPLNGLTHSPEQISCTELIAVAGIPFEGDVEWHSETGFVRSQGLSPGDNLHGSELKPRCPTRTNAEPLRY